MSWGFEDVSEADRYDWTPWPDPKGEDEKRTTLADLLNRPMSGRQAQQALLPKNLLLDLAVRAEQGLSTMREITRKRAEDPSIPEINFEFLLAEIAKRARAYSEHLQEVEVPRDQVITERTSSAEQKEEQ